MKTLIIAFALSALSVPAMAQQFHGTDCDLAYKKLAQHYDSAAGACREQTVSRGLDGATDKGKTARRAEQAARKAK